MKKILVAMSGGVDSSVAALLLKKAGYFVIGATMKLIPCGKEKAGGCCGIEAVISAKKVARKLNIPHYVLNFEKEFEQKVIKNFISEYSNGRTPNPCVKCNQYIKFNLLLKRAKELGCQYLATGHYARIKSEIQNPKSETNPKFEIRNPKHYFLYKGKDKKKDQSYFLYTLNQKQLKYLIFPLANLTKKQVRQIAKKEGLPVFDRPESQEICFVPDNDYRKFLKRNLKKIKPGLIFDKSGNVLGKHQGIAFYTIGQRRGLGQLRSELGLVTQKDAGAIKSETRIIKLSTEHEIRSTKQIQNLNVQNSKRFGFGILNLDIVPMAKPSRILDEIGISDFGFRISDFNKPCALYVIKIDAKKNTLVVGREKDLYSKELVVKNVNWISGKPPRLPLKAKIKIRYKHKEALASITKSLNPKRYTLIFNRPQRAITPGQAVVFYSGQEVLGGGTIQ